MAKRHLLLTTALAAGLFVAAESSAQVAAAPGTDTAVDKDTPSATPVTQNDAKNNEIVVVGSLIRHRGFDSASPVQVITRDEMTIAGFSSTAEVLQSTSITNGTSQINNYFGGYVTDGGPGANTIGLRGLGADRTLVLLNGRRIAPSGTRGSVGSADLNVLPNAIIDSIEILKDGASSIYGSDAVAGVIDIMTMKRVDGITIEAKSTVPEAGGGVENRVSLVGGYNTDRFHVMASVDYYQRSNLTLNDRSWSQCQTDYRRAGAGQPFGSADFIDPKTGKDKCYPLTGTGDNGVTINTIGTNSVAGRPAAGAVGTTFNRFRPNAAVTTGVVGYEGVGGGSNSLNVRDTFDPAMLLQSLVTPAKTYTGFLSASYESDVLGHAEPYVEVLFNRRTSSQTLYRQLTLDYAKGSPLIPSNLAFSTVQSAPTAVTNGKALGVRAFIGYGLLPSSQKSDFTKIGGGVRGDFLFSDWRYDLYASDTFTRATYHQSSFLTSRVAKSLNVVASGGGFACVDASDGCVAAPFLTPAVVGGNLPAAFRNYIVKDVVGSTKFDEQLANFTVNGPIFQLPYGSLGGAFGAEYRHDHINDSPAPESVSGDLYNLTSSAPTKGSDALWELFGEIDAPLLRNLPFAHDLTVGASARYTHYRSYGANHTYKFNGRYSPVSWLSARATYGTSYRAPALFEQFLGATSGFQSSQGDPCNNYGAAGTNAIRVANCKSEGLDPNFQATNSIAVLTQGGADAHLKPETSKNLTIGGVIEPKLPDSIGSFAFSVDYFRIKVQNGVSRAGYSFLLQQCYDNPGFRAAGGYCNLIDPRTPGSNALTVHDSYVNLATEVVRGLDFNARIEHKFTPSTSLIITGNATRFMEQSYKLFPTDPLTDSNGLTIGHDAAPYPKWTGTGEAILKVNKLRFRYSVDWVGKTNSYADYGEDPATSAYLLKTPDYFLHDMSIQYEAKTFSITAGIRNLFDRNPPQISSGVASRVANAPLYSGYDFVGRRYFVNFTGHFGK